METIETIKEILQNNLGIAPDGINESATFESLGVDSLDMVELICDLEEKCGIDFGEPEGLDSIGDLVKYIESL